MEEEREPGIRAFGRELNEANIRKKEVQAAVKEIKSY